MPSYKALCHCCCGYHYVKAFSINYIMLPRDAGMRSAESTGGLSLEGGEIIGEARKNMGNSAEIKGCG